MKIFRLANDDLISYLTDKFTDTSISVLNQVSNLGATAQEKN
jgi:hypothetical protein